MKTRRQQAKRIVTVIDSFWMLLLLLLCGKHTADKQKKIIYYTLYPNPCDNLINFSSNSSNKQQNVTMKWTMKFAHIPKSDREKSKQNDDRNNVDDDDGWLVSGLVVVVMCT